MYGIGSLSKLGLCTLLFCSSIAIAASPGLLTFGNDWSQNARIIDADNNPSNLLSQISFERNLIRLDQIAHSSTQQLALSPWADRRWPMAQGMIASRYLDVQFQAIAAKNNFSATENYVNQNSLRATLARVGNNRAAIDILSPAEKYDLLVGDLDGTLTKRLWQEASDFNRKGDGITHWSGLCEGSAGAAVGSVEPVKPIVLKSTANGYSIPFHAMDIKALLALSWSSYGIDIPTVGLRCTKSMSGPALDSACWDTNPAAWHIAVLNLVGNRKGHLIFDRDPGVEVWNVPVLAYSYTYFNPSTGAPASTLREAMVGADSHTDYFHANRSAGTRFIVGVKMTVTSGQRSTKGVASDGSTPLLPRFFTYVYDLELSANGEILGGEWRGNLDHPDFIWAIAPRTKPHSLLDASITSPWRSGESMPISWRAAAVSASSNLQILSPVLDRLVDLSSAH